jgi:hypothetical protein
VTQQGRVRARARSIAVARRVVLHRTFGPLSAVIIFIKRQVVLRRSDFDRAEHCRDN